MNEVEIVALNALRYLARETDRFSRFLDLTGLQPHDVAARAGQTEVLAGILDYLLTDEKLLVDFAEENGLDPQSIAKMRHSLPGATSL